MILIMLISMNLNILDRKIIIKMNGIIISNNFFYQENSVLITFHLAFRSSSLFNLFFFEFDLVPYISQRSSEKGIAAFDEFLTAHHFIQ